MNSHAAVTEHQFRMHRFNRASHEDETGNSMKLREYQKICLLCALPYPIGSIFISKGTLDVVIGLIGFWILR